ncbi:hypothetical protein [Cerasicoccus fimbriatus]|uniref:hypothetical protein n=1 Tax=Cerasicoccus fimbriatus TaxID=3014554 RepID=UPI0022B2B26F|nr:hypothetical protein [Cerasicoccus sp. TK19100]
MNFPRISLFALLASVALAAVADAAPRRLSDLGSSNNLTDKKFDTSTVESPRADEMFGADKDKINFKEWHGSYSSIGDKRVDALQGRGGKEFATSELNYNNIPRREAQISLESDERKMANVQNWNRLRDNVMSHKFSGTDLNTPDAQHFSEMVDEVSLRDVNRYQFWQNKTDDGIPVQTAGGDSGPQLSAEQRRVMARINGMDVEVNDYRQQDTKGVGDMKQASAKGNEEPGFFESLFDW